ncbi:MAG: 3-dehydroquinate dehydratase [Chthoniobacter sp.]|jgi:3-dehydroquinate dehydratase-1|nr:3-dehydroquinate dehydratase [Chthoniobacter sp.]
MGKDSSVLTTKPLVVGTVHSPESLQFARRLRPGKVDLLELRVDHFAVDPQPLLRAATHFHLPVIVTVRHPAEGGLNALTLGRRRELYGQFLACAAYIDVELRSAEALAGIVAAARERGTRVILSAHDFRATPPAARLQRIVRAAAVGGADLVKIATRADTLAELQRLLGLFATKSPRPLSVMAMGRFGKISRLLFAQAGSVLSYGYLAAANASGQWPAVELKERLAELAA